MPLRVLTWGSLRPATKQVDPETAYWVDRSANDCSLVQRSQKSKTKGVPDNRIYSELRLQLCQPNVAQNDPGLTAHYHDYGERLDAVAA